MEEGMEGEGGREGGRGRKGGREGDRDGGSEEGRKKEREGCDSEIREIHSGVLSLSVCLVTGRIFSSRRRDGCLGNTMFVLIVGHTAVYPLD